MKQIYKYKLENIDEQSVEMPAGAKILTVQVQYGNPVIWAICDTEAEKTETRVFRIYGTGHDIDESVSDTYIGSYQLYSGQFVGHLFEKYRI
jgi:hypothetical protein